ncbi:hypothetical protein CLU79DRAFT_745654 [Phycomyces nitens]|nr:hypothetical protein CLU79DRAFT_745654 [Phycomyces nitens]
MTMLDSDDMHRSTDHYSEGDQSPMSLHSEERSDIQKNVLASFPELHNISSMDHTRDHYNKDLAHDLPQSDVHAELDFEFSKKTNLTTRKNARKNLKQSKNTMDDSRTRGSSVMDSSIRGSSLFDDMDPGHNMLDSSFLSTSSRPDYATNNLDAILEGLSSDNDTDEPSKRHSNDMIPHSRLRKKRTVRKPVNIDSSTEIQVGPITRTRTRSQIVEAPLAASPKEPDGFEEAFDDFYQNNNDDSSASEYEPDEMKQRKKPKVKYGSDSDDLWVNTEKHSGSIINEEQRRKDPLENMMDFAEKMKNPDLYLARHANKSLSVRDKVSMPTGPSPKEDPVKTKLKSLIDTIEPPIKRKRGRPKGSGKTETKNAEIKKLLLLRKLKETKAAQTSAPLKKASHDLDDPFSDDEDPKASTLHADRIEEDYRRLKEELERGKTMQNTNSLKPACQYNPYFLYNKAVRKDITKNHPELSNIQITRLIAKQWNELPEAEKKVYNDESAEKRAQLKKARGKRGRNERYPPNSFVLFAKDYGKIIREQNPEYNLYQVTKITSGMWKTIDQVRKLTRS